jgi:hypothetical protein
MGLPGVRRLCARSSPRRLVSERRGQPPGLGREAAMLATGSRVAGWGEHRLSLPSRNAQRPLAVRESDKAVNKNDNRTERNARCSHAGS